ncbi:MAG: alanine racemase [Bacteroidota bacterium]
MRITKPTLLVDQEKCSNNIERMVSKTKNANAQLRPHFKTHHSAQIGEWYRSHGVDKCTVSSVSMAEYFIKNGWDDLTIAFPYNPLESEEISHLATNANLNILIESEESLQLANELISENVGFYIKIDIGTHRTGIAPDNQELLEKLVTHATEKVSFQGLLAHAGHTYHLHTNEEIKRVFDESVDLLAPLKRTYGGLLSFGDTPTCSVVEDLSAFDEIRAGNFVFYDWMQKDIGSCTFEDIAVCMACPVVAIHKERNEVVVYGGAVHLSKDFIVEDGTACFGKVVLLDGQLWNTSVIGNVCRLSQEHGILHLPSEQIDKIKVGDLIGVIPVHSCLAADLQGHYFTTGGQKVEKFVKE